MDASNLNPGDVFVDEMGLYNITISDSGGSKRVCFLTGYSSNTEYCTDMKIILRSVETSRINVNKYICNIMRSLFQLQLKIHEMESRCE